MMRKSTPSTDRLPENTSYRDTGCDLYASCLACPLPQCRYDEPGWVQRSERNGRYERILQFREAHPMPVAQLAAQFGISTRTIHRIVRRQPGRTAVAS